MGLQAFGAGTNAAGKRPAVQTAWGKAIAARVEFEAEGAKTRAGFTRVLDGFRAIYHDNPAEVHAAEAVNAVAELLAEQGRALGDRKSLEGAVGQYEFLRREYPASGLRVGALLAEGEIEETDLGDADAAREKYRGVLKEGARTAAGMEARGRLAGLGRGTSAQGGGLDPTHRDVAARKGAQGVAGSPTHRGETAMNGAQSLGGAQGVGAGGTSEAPLETHVSEARHGLPEATAVVAAAPVVRRTSLAQVTGIRHWSTPTYTRVAIDLGGEVTFEAARVPHPDRIYFDLHGARLGAELVGKSFDVTDDGFLKKIRAAQAAGDVTRVVLDVNDVTEYSAFLLPNPYRLIIDIHGAKAGGEGAGTPEVKTEIAETPVTAGAGRQASAAANVSGLPAMRVTDGGEMRRGEVIGTGAREVPQGGAAAALGHVDATAVPAPRTGVVAKVTAARPVPNTVAVKTPAAGTDVAAVSDAPGKVEATNAPTSKPIAAVVKDRAGVRVQPVSLGSGSTGRSSGTSSGAAARDTVNAGSVISGRGSVNSAATPGKAAEKTADGQTSLVRALGLKIGRIVIDAGHGGHDSGTLGVDGIEEKDVVLDVALRLGKLLHERLGAEIIYTRSDDTFIPLETRTAIANKAQADLFLSIHANSSPDETARGVETYYLNFTSDPTALDVAARENAVGGQSIHQLSDLVKKIALKDKIAESREFAADVEGSLYAGLEKGNAGLKNRGVKKAPFVVLIGANMPSILAEISFVTNGRDAAQLREPEYRERVAESLFNGVVKYENGLAGAKAAPEVRAAAK